MSNPILTKNYTAGGAIGPNLIVKWGAADYTVVAAAAATDHPVGVTRANITAASGDQIDVITNGEYEIKAGGTIARGDPLTSDASGQAIAATTGQYMIGFAKKAGVIGDLVLASIQPAIF